MNIAKNLEGARREYPDKQALLFEGQSFTYQQLDELSSRAANVLRTLGIDRGDRVALYLPNIPSLITLYFGIQKIGAVAVTINTGLKSDEVAFIVEDSRATLLVTTATLHSEAPTVGFACLQHILLAEDDTVENSVENSAENSAESLSLPALLASATAEAPAVPMMPNEPAVLLYTSGTTGFPKGAMLSQGNLCSNVESCVKTLALQATDRVLLFLPLFHNFGQNAAMHPCFAVGATLILQRQFTVASVLQAITAHAVTTFYGVPTIYTFLLEEATPKEMQSIQRYISAAANLPQEIGNRWFERYGCMIQEGYGLSETSLVTFNHAPQYKPGSVGTPLAGITIKIMDNNGAEMLAGELGEIVVQGPNVMLGYWQRAADTARVLQHGWFHTGDIGYVDSDGYLTIVDRVKDMINVAGQKVYPSEVENVLYQHPAVAEAAVYQIPDAVLGEQVCASVVLNAEETVEATEIFALCRARLADFKVPTTLIFDAELPKGRTGKILKRVLRDTYVAKAQTQYRPDLLAQLEDAAAAVRPALLLAAFQEIVGTLVAQECSTVALETPINRLIIDSIAAVRLRDQVAAWNVHFPPATFLSAITVGQLVAQIEEQLIANHFARPLLAQGGVEEGSYPTLAGQPEMYKENVANNHVSLTLRIRSPLDREALQEAFQAIVDRHANLRVTFAEQCSAEGKPAIVQIVHATRQVDFQHYSVPALPWDELADQVRQAATSLFDLTQDSMLRVRLWQRADHDAILLITQHHIITDGWSIWHFLDELQQLYQGIAQGTKVTLPPLPITYGDCVHWYHDRLHGAEGERIEAYWRKQLADAPMLDLPIDYPRPQQPLTLCGATHQFRFAADLLPQLNRLAQAEGVTLYKLVLAAYKILLHDETNQPDILVGTWTTNRPRAEFTPLFGYFTKLMLTCSTVHDDRPFGDFLQCVSKNVTDALAHEGYSYYSVVKAMGGPRAGYAEAYQVNLGLQTAPVFPDAVAIYDPSFVGTFDFGGLSVEPITIVPPTWGATCELDLQIFIGGTAMVGYFYYNTELFAERTAIDMMARFQRLLMTIVDNPQANITTLRTAMRTIPEKVSL